MLLSISVVEGRVVGSNPAPFNTEALSVRNGAGSHLIVTSVEKKLASLLLASAKFGIENSTEFNSALCFWVVGTPQGLLEQFIGSFETGT